MTSLRGTHLRPEGNRLDVLRGLISDVTNAAKASKAVTTDAQMLKIIRKRVKSSEAAVEEFQSAKRDDLKDREVAQIAVLEAYIGDSDSMGEDDIAKAIQDVIGRMRSEEKTVNQGSVMKSMLGPGGTLEDRTVDKQVVARLVKGELHFPSRTLSFETWYGLLRPVLRPNHDPKRPSDSQMVQACYENDLGLSKISLLWLQHKTRYHHYGDTRKSSKIQR